MTNSKKTKYFPSKEVIKILYIYMFTNKLNGKRYIGQTNNIEKRLRGHKSDMNNKKSHSYNDAFHSALRKYGWSNFDFSILEEIPDECGREYLNQREKDFILEFHTRTTENGYNITAGGDGCEKGPLSFEQKCKLSKLFTEDEIREIQLMLINDYCAYEILEKFPKLSQSLLNNINVGYNFKRDDLNYPLSKSTSRKFSKETREKIIAAIKDNIPYSEIATTFSISIGMVSCINNGKVWHDKNISYPICKKSCADGSYVHDLKFDLLFTSLSSFQLGKKYNKSPSTITAINVGRNRKDSRFKYPLRDNLEENKKIWNTLF